jgi:predicted dehydrogenase
MKEDPSINLVSICDVDRGKFENMFGQGEFGQPDIQYDFSGFKRYSDPEEMIEMGDLDIVDIVLPTPLHSEIAIKAMHQGINVLCEKPMARNLKQCEEMISVSKQTNRKLMIAHCLRFWPAYVYLKETVDCGRLGRVVGAYFFRGGSPPVWSYQNWLLVE